MPVMLLLWGVIRTVGVPRAWALGRIGNRLDEEGLRARQRMITENRTSLNRKCKCREVDSPPFACLDENAGLSS